MPRFTLFLLCLPLALACKNRQPEAAAPPVRTEPLAPLLAAPSSQDGGETEREALFDTDEAPVFGSSLPATALRLKLHGEQLELGDWKGDWPSGAEAVLSARLKGQQVMLEPDEDTFLAQAAPVLAWLKAQAVPTWLLHPEGKVAYRLTLLDEADFQTWLGEIAPGKLRVIQRADGFELMTSVGKLPGGDPNGPSVPVRGGRQDFATLRQGLSRLKVRFKTAEEVCFVPSFGTELTQVARALSSAYEEESAPLFETLCLVFPGGRSPPQN